MRRWLPPSLTMRNLACIVPGLSVFILHCHAKNGIKNKARCQLSKLQFESFRIVLHEVASIYHLTKHCRVRAMIHCNYFECFEYLWNNSPEVIQQFENKGKFMRIFQRKSLKDF